MKRYTVRMNCEYATEIEAESPTEAARAAEELDPMDWDSKCWSPILEVEEGI